MKVFISHATKNKEIVLKFTRLLENVSSEIQTFCTSDRGSIKLGRDFIETIFEELNNSDLFIPIISKEYYESRFCMIELGVAYSYFYNKYKKKGEDYIFPFSIYPVQKGQALSGTPIANIQTGDIGDKDDINTFLNYLSSEKGIDIGSVNKAIHSYKYEIDQIFLRLQNLVEMAKIGTYFDDSIFYKHKEDIVNYSIKDNAIVVNFNMNPYEKEDVIRPNFVSAVLRYVDKLDLAHYLDFNDDAEFGFVLTSFTNSLKRIFVEFKYSDNNEILEVFELPIEYGENELRLSLKKMRSKALSNISEICFVVHPDDIVEDEGMFKISKIGILELDKKR